jgi:hypothetical protein
VADRLRVREIDDDEGQHRVRIVRRGSGSVVTWRRAQMVLLSAQGMDVAAIAKVAFTSEDRVRDVTRGRFMEFCRYLRSLCPPSTRMAIVEIAYTPTNSSWLNRIEAQFTALRYFALDGTDHLSHQQQASMIRRYIIWRNSHASRPTTPPDR